LNIAPTYYGLKIFTYNDSRYGLILMEHYGGNDLKNSGTLEDLLKIYDIKQDEKGIKPKIKKLLDTLYENDLDYGEDLHGNNILYKKLEDDTYEFKLIDFENITPIKKDGSFVRNYNINISISDSALASSDIINVSGGKRKYKSKKRKPRKY
jgi:hypothetical protein